MKENLNDMDILSAFGLTDSQTALLFSLQKVCALTDANSTKTDTQEVRKIEWIEKWSSILSTTHDNEWLIMPSELVRSFKEELSTSKTKTWFHLIILEAVTFRPYFVLSENNDENKQYKGLRYKNQVAFLEDFIIQVGYGKPEMARNYSNMYDKAIEKATGKAQKIAMNTMFVALAGALVAATAGIATKPIAIALVGAKVTTGLSGAALLNACLAFLGGGALATGGAGMLGGTMVIIGGGALLGVTTGGALIAGKEAFFTNNPIAALTFAAKLNVVLREIILNEQKDTKLAQAVLHSFKDSIVQLNAQLTELRLENEKSKERIKNMEKSISYLERIYMSMD